MVAQAESLKEAENQLKKLHAQWGMA